MSFRELRPWQHDHTFGQDARRPGESRTMLVIALTALMMVVEIGAGLAYGSMALLADGLHMASHAIALSIAAFAYVYARRHAADERFSFGTGKVNALAGFAGAVLLAVFALMMAWESVARILSPVGIAFNQAIGVAIAGLLVNGLSVVLLGHHHGEHDDEDEEDRHHHHDHNLRSAYLHVLADALTSVLAIFALLAGKYLGLFWMDPAMGVVGALLVARWSIGLLRATAEVLLDRQAPPHLTDSIRTAITQDADTEVADLHVWSVGPGIYSAILSVVTATPEPPEHYKRLLPEHERLVHVTVEVHGREHDVSART
ncbi:CDF family Co(II)/Ni(II) efflux transporter DmeF [Engelhardtia mirabilis]|uniref:Cadmium, cobalt and zinc/H(+)-K(+) antiporter n=1 Tax=Engelhardtia mirabilis TaxID=2528011 RepID=A0A518BS33_9BACT|nr:Cadmium, cobalt and zinc/H(+)-K(+) antiporter [Planctomycetes bacterium Pla133]QDV04101.1 Cadmium, cobalt and zinc/H(+)-K(+) antiporter [Planctomycetes bacterium Pla86]